MTDAIVAGEFTLVFSAEMSLVNEPSTLTSTWNEVALRTGRTGRG